VHEGCVVVTAQYENGSAMPYAVVEIRAPGSKEPSHRGKTDNNGRFCFSPDISGEWSVAVNDQMGHSFELTVPVSDELVLQKDADTAGKKAILYRYQKAMMGVSLIVGIGGILFWWKGRKNLRIK